jgi:hypothetical protein
MSSGPHRAPAGARVRIVQTLLTPEQRAPGLPSDTASLPYLLRATGELLEDGDIGQVVSVRTATGRTLAGVLEVIEPGDTHSFGTPHLALRAAASAIVQMRDELR